MSDFDVKNTERYQQAVQARDWQTCDLMFDEFNFLVEQLKQTQDRLKDADYLLKSIQNEHELDFVCINEYFKKYGDNNE